MAALKQYLIPDLVSEVLLYELPLSIEEAKALINNDHDYKTLVMPTVSRLLESKDFSQEEALFALIALDTPHALTQAIKNDYAASVAYLINEQSIDAEMLLPLVSPYGKVKVAQIILDCGVSQEILDIALILAAVNGHLRIVKMLLAAGANAHTENGNLVVTAAYQYPEINQIFATTPITAFNGEDTAFVAAAGNGHLEIVKLLLAAGANVNAQNGTGLILAAGNGHTAMVEFLLAHGANVHVQDDAALTGAAASGHLEVVIILLAHGANVHAQDETALIAASEEGYTEIAKVLVAAGAGEEAYAYANPIAMRIREQILAEEEMED